MPKRKRNAVFQVLVGGTIFAYTDLAAEDIQAVEGIASVAPGVNCLIAWVDPRYDADEVAAELQERADRLATMPTFCVADETA